MLTLRAMRDHSNIAQAICRVCFVFLFGFPLGHYPKEKNFTTPLNFYHTGPRSSNK